jgi:hypothetical protein
MRWSSAVLLVPVLVIASNGFSAEPEPSWVGAYANTNLLNGHAVFHLSVEQSGDAIGVSFDAAYNDGHGAAPDGQGKAKITDNNTLEFKWEDSFNNSGTGRITHAGPAIIVSMKTTRVVEPRCLAFYGNKMRLKRVLTPSGENARRLPASAR